MSLVFSTFFFSTIAQSTQQDILKKELQQGLNSGCLEKQSQSKLSKNSDFTLDVCSCYAKNSTEQIFSNIDFQIALKKKDDADIRTAIAQIINKEYSTIIFQQCLNNTQERFNKAKEQIFDKSKNELSNKRGLLGESRDSFLNSGIIECVELSKSPSPNAQAFCSCSVGSMADNLSQQDLYEIGVNSNFGKKKMKEMGELGMKRCAHLLN